MTAPRRRSLRGLTLAVLIPCLLFSATLSGWITYRDLYGVILNDGFEMKLDVVSTGVAAFVQGTDHKELSRGRILNGVTADPVEAVLWGIESGLGELVEVDMVSGSALRAGPLPFENLAGLAFDVPAGRLIANRPATGELVTFQPGSAEGIPAGRIAAGARDIAMTQDGTTLAAVGPWGLQGYTRQADGTLRQAWTMDVDANSVAISPHTGQLFVLGPEGALSVADTPGAPLVNAGSFSPLDEYTDPGEIRAIQQMTSSPLTDELFGAASQLLALDPTELTADVADFRRGYRDQSGTIYMGYVEPMQRIRSKLDLTYLYTQNLVPGDSIQYILDGTPLGDDHSPIGTREALESDADIRGLTDVVDQGTVYSSGIEDSEDWGLLKSAYAPIFEDGDGITGMVGTDISVSTIQDRTQIALAKVGLVTIVVLFLGGLGSILISLRLTGPLAAVQEGATRVAAGRRGERLAAPRLRDLADLTTSFNEMTQKLTSAVDKLTDETERVESMRRRRHLVHELATRARQGTPLPPGLAASREHGEGDAVMPTRILVTGPRENPLVIAILTDSPDALAALAEREEVAVVSDRIITHDGPDPEVLIEALSRFCTPDETSLLVIQPTSRTAWSVGSLIVSGQMTESGKPSTVSLKPGESIEVPVQSQLDFSLGADLPTGGHPWRLSIEEESV